MNAEVVVAAATAASTWTKRARENFRECKIKRKRFQLSSKNETMTNWNVQSDLCACCTVNGLHPRGARYKRYCLPTPFDLLAGDMRTHYKIIVSTLLVVISSEELKKCSVKTKQGFWVLDIKISEESLTFFYK